MEATLVLAIINGLLSSALQIWSSARQILGEDAIPEWSEIILKNQTLQDKIDAELR